MEKKDPRIHNGWQIGDLGPVRREPHPVTRHLLPFVGLLLGGCLYQPEPNKQSADEDVYGILGETTKKLTGALCCCATHNARAAAARSANAGGAQPSAAARTVAHGR